MGKASHLLGPYQEGQRFRLCVYQGERRVKSIWCHSRAEAEAVKQRMSEALNDAGSRTLGETLDEYLADARKQGLSPSSLRTFDYRLRAFLPAALTLGELTAKQAAALYQRETERTGRGGQPITAATQRATLKAARGLFRWIVERGYVQENPFARIKPVGHVSTGKRQLRIDEARKLCDLLRTRGEQGDEGATAVLTQLLLGLRSSEVLNRRVRDLDNHGQELWIERGKTKNARRRLAIQSDALRKLLVQQTRGREPQALLFGKDRTLPYPAIFLWRRMEKYCALAGVPRVCPHSLRGLHSTIAFEKGATSGLVASALGHGSFAVTARHYVDPSALLSTQARKVADALAGAPEVDVVDVVDVQAMGAFLAGLPKETLDAILRSVAEHR